MMRKPTTLLVILSPLLLFSRMAASESAGFEPYEGLKEQFTLALPHGWLVYNQSRSGSPHGVVMFSSASLRISGKGKTKAELIEMSRVQATQVDSGELASFFVDRYPAKSGMSCNGFSKGASKAKLRVLTSATALGGGSKLIEPAQVEPMALGGCQGLKVLVRAQTPEGWELVMLVYSFSDDQTTYDFTLRNRKEFFEKNRPVFDKVLSTLKITKSK